MMEINKQIETLLLAYLTKQATTEELHTLKTWVNAAPEHYRYFQETVNVWQGAHPAFNPDEIDVIQAEKNIRRKMHKNPAYKKILLYWQRAAAIIVIPLIIYSLYLMRQTDSAAHYGEAEYQELTVPFGMSSKLDLPDGSNVWLNGGSSLKYPIRFTKKNRAVKLSGEGYFEVQSDKQCPFIVQTSRMTLTATGTAFNIEAYDTDSVTTVAMISGKIDVAFAGRSPINMNVGEYARFNSLTSVCSVQQMDVSQKDFYKWYAWKDGLMIFRDDPLAYVFKRLEQTFNVRITIHDPQIAESHYRATFEKESLDEILRLLEMTAPIQFKRHNYSRTNNESDKQSIEVYKRK